MFKRLGSLIAAALLAVSIGAPTAIAHTHSPLHYSANCSTGGGASGGQYFVSKDSVGQMTGVRSNVSISILQECIGGGANGGWSIISGANALGNGEFAQLGYAVQACGLDGTGCLGTWGHSAHTRWFWYTKFDDNGGGIYNAPWVDVLDGDASDTDVPLTGDIYTFSITQQPGPVWRYCIIVVSSSTYPVGNSDCTTRAQSGGKFDTAYWSAEVYNGASGMGSVDGAATPLVFTPMQYAINGGAFTSMAGTTSCSWSASSGLSEQSGYHCSVINQGTNPSTFSAYTTLHQ